MRSSVSRPRGLRRTVEDLTRTALTPFFRTDLCVVDAYHGARAGVSRSADLFWQLLHSTPELRARRVIPGRCIPLDLGAIEATLWLANPRDLPRTRTKLPWLASRNRREIGYWYYELDRLPVAQAQAAEGLSEIWVASEFVAESIGRSCDVPVRVIPPPVLLGGECVGGLSKGDDSSRQPGPMGAANRFLVSLDAYSSVERKNPWIAIEAFKEAFKDQPEKRLTVRVSRPEGLSQELRDRLLAESSEQISIHLETFPSAGEAQRFMARHDVYVSPHRTEGLGLHIVEAILLGLSVVATGYGGNIDFCDPEGIDLIPFELVPGEDPQGLYTGSFVWAEPDQGHLCSLLLAVSQRREEEGRARLEKARRTVIRHFDTERIRSLILDSLGANRRLPPP